MQLALLRDMHLIKDAFHALFAVGEAKEFAPKPFWPEAFNAAKVLSKSLQARQNVPASIAYFRRAHLLGSHRLYPLLIAQGDEGLRCCS